MPPRAKRPCRHRGCTAVTNDVVVKGLIAEVTDFIAGNINSVSTWIGQFGMKVFENQPLDERLPESVLQADGGSATATGS